ncbi:unnamed protein product, partial [Linum tenue]
RYSQRRSSGQSRSGTPPRSRREAPPVARFHREQGFRRPSSGDRSPPRRLRSDLGHRRRPPLFRQEDQRRPPPRLVLNSPAGSRRRLRPHQEAVPPPRPPPPPGQEQIPLRRSRLQARRRRVGRPLRFLQEIPLRSPLLQPVHQGRFVQRRQQNARPSSRRSSRMASFWTLCPYCYIMYEYPRVYEDCCLRCQKCERAFHAALIHSLPPMVPGKESYYCSWGVFPLGFMLGNGDKTSASDAAAASGSAFVNWMPPMFGGGGQQQFSDRNGAPPPPPPPPAAAATTFPVVTPAVPQSTVPPSLPVQGSSSGVAPRKRGRPRKNPLPGQT